MARLVAIERVAETAMDVPLGSKIGLLVMAVGLAADVLAHFGPGVQHDHGSMSGPELSAHLVVFVGMALVLVGVIVDGVRTTRAHRRDGN